MWWVVSKRKKDAWLDKCFQERGIVSVLNFIIIGYFFAIRRDIFMLFRMQI